MASTGRVWICVACQRRVPQAVSTCRCGWPRETPLPAAPPAAAPPLASRLAGWAPALALLVAALWSAWWFLRTPVGTSGGGGGPSPAPALLGPGPDERPPAVRAYSPPRSPAPPPPSPPTPGPGPVIAYPPRSGIAAGGSEAWLGEESPGEADRPQPAANVPRIETVRETASEMDQRRETGRAVLRQQYQYARGLAAELDARIDQYRASCPRNALEVPDCTRHLERVGRVALELVRVLENADETARTAGLPPGVIRDLRDEYGLNDGACERLMARARELR